MTAKAVTDLPEPLSPTSATVSPLSTLKPTCSSTLHHARAGAELDRQVFDRERGNGGHVAPASDR